MALSSRRSEFQRVFQRARHYIRAGGGKSRGLYALPARPIDSRLSMLDHAPGDLMTRMRIQWLLGSAAICLSVAAQAVAAAGKSDDAPTLTSGIDTSAFDTSVKPRDDFYQYVN